MFEFLLGLAAGVAGMAVLGLRFPDAQAAVNARVRSVWARVTGGRDA